MPKLIVIGASAGGVQALLQLTAAFPASLPAPVLITQHVGAHRSLLPELLSRKCSLPVEHARHDQPLRPHQILLAPPDHHLLVADGKVRLHRGPKENFARPAIDPMFRSAALAYGPAVIGVVLTGRLDDGTAGLKAIKQYGGIAVVQDPGEAMEPSMPQSALRYVDVDHRVSLKDMPMLLHSLAVTPIPTGPSDPPRGPAIEQDLALGRGHPLKNMEAIGKPSPFACPDCHGGLWQLDDAQPPRYRCHTGHAFTARSLQHAMGVTREQAQWNTLRALQEEQLLREHMAQVHREAGETQTASALEASAAQLKSQVDSLRAAMEAGPDPAA